MRKIFALLLAVSFLASFSVMAAEDGAKPFYMPKAVESGDYPNIKFGGQTFFNYNFNRTAGANFNSFNINRVLFTAYGHVAEKWMYGFAFDVAPFFNLVSSATISDGSTVVTSADPGDVHVDMAYMGYDFGDHKIYAGIIDTVFEGYVLYNIWEHRRLAWSPLLGNGYSTAGRWDLGIAINGFFMEKMIEYHFGIYNGESYLDISEFSNHKAVQARVTVKPFEELLAFTVGMEYDKASQAASNQFVVPIIIAANLMDGMVKPGLIFACERMGGESAYMLSFLFNAYVMEKINPFLRLDYGIKNDIIGGPSLGEKDMNLFAGAGYHFNDHVIVDLAFIWSKVDATDTNSYTFGPFAEVRF